MKNDNKQTETEFKFVPDISPGNNIEKSLYTVISSNKVSNVITSVHKVTSGNIEKNKFSGENTITLQDKSQIFSKSLESLDSIMMIQSKKLFEGIILFYQVNHKISSFSDRDSVNESKIDTGTQFTIKEYMTLIGKDYHNKNERKHITKIVKQSLNSMIHLNVKYEKSKDSFEAINLFQYLKLENGLITVDLSKKFAAKILTAPLTPYPLWIMRMDNRKKTEYYIAKKLSQHYGMRSNRVNGNYRHISVKSLLLSIKSLPAYEWIKENDPVLRYSSRIREPFEKAMDNLEDMGRIKWQYVYKHGKNIPDEALAKDNFIVFYNQYFVEFDMVDFPDSEIIEGKIKEIQSSCKQKKKKK